ncbi:MAG TPA: hypothetical protein VKX17_28280 [Planctomycetota bacterium]|nr:hypothetical protein [Planctomycetota bacterium]
MNSDLPESWQRALNEKRDREAAEQTGESDAAKRAKPRTPIQPVFKLRWGFLTLLLPVGALFAAFGSSLLIRADFPNWFSGTIFYGLLAGGNGMILSLAIGFEHRHGRFAQYCAATGIFSVCLFLIPGASVVYVVFLILYLIARGVALGGVMTIFVFIVGIGVSIVFLVVVNKVLDNAVMTALDSGGGQLALALVAACPLAHSLCTAALPAEKTFFGHLDAMITGLSAALLGMFAALVSYRMLMAITMVVGEFSPPHIADVMFAPITQFAAAGVALALGNWFLVRQLFRFAYSAREERPARVRKTDAPATRSGDAYERAAYEAPERVRARADDDADVDEAT